MMLNLSMSEREWATVLAALRFYQEQGQTRSAHRSAWIEVIATDAGRLKPLKAKELEQLCLRLNSPATHPNES
jgi:hypothetical protein